MILLLRNLLVLFCALCLALVLFPIGLLYSFWKAIIRMSLKKAIVYLANLALSISKSIDLMGNVVCADLFNDTMVKPDGYRHGIPTEYISAVYGKNKRLGRQRDLGRAVANFLNFLDRNHVEDASG